MIRFSIENLRKEKNAHYCRLKIASTTGNTERLRGAEKIWLTHPMVLYIKNAQQIAAVKVICLAIEEQEVKNKKQL